MKSLKQKFYDNVNRFICWIKKNRRIKLKVNNNIPFNVNIGCGLTVAREWINVDGTPHALFSGWPRFVLNILYKISGAGYEFSLEEYCNIMHNNTFIHHKVEYGLPFFDNSVDCIFTSHMLEHLFKEDSKKFLKEVFRVLKPNGLVRICVPDLEYAFSLYRTGETEKALSLFFVPTHFNYLYQHRYMYDYKLAKKFLMEAGFNNVIKCSYKQGNVPDLDKLDVKPDETLYVEASKFYDSP